jgi:hypothetical protein
MGDAMAPGDEARLGPLVRLRARLRAEVDMLRRWHGEMGEALKTKDRRLRLVETSMELLQWLLERGPAGGACAEDRKRVPQAAQASCWGGGGARRASERLTWTHTVRQARCLGDDKDEGPRLNLTALPPCVWREHVAPVLSGGEAAGLRVVCKALKALGRQWPMRLRDVALDDLEAALTCFPATESLPIVAKNTLAPAEERRMVEVLRGHGGTLRRVMAEGEGAGQLLISAVCHGALPNLTFMRLSLQSTIRRQLLSEGRLGSLEEVEVTLHPEEGEHPKALEHLRDLPLLRRLSLSCAKRITAALPPFIPPSLKSLVLIFTEAVTLEALLRELPAMLQASGASLEEIDIRAPKNGLSLEGDALLAQVLQECTGTLKTLKLGSLQGRWGSARIQGSAAGIMGCCSTLEVLHCPWAVFSALPVTSPSFPRLTKLHLQGGADETIIGFSPRLSPSANIGFSPRLWDIMITGRLPALAELSVAGVQWDGLGEDWATDGGRRLARAFEAVGGTLRRLTLTGPELKGEGACHELGAAIGKLRRLRYLHLGLPRGGKTCHRIARGVAASGGCPELLQLTLTQVSSDVELLTYEPSLIAPTVRDLRLGDVQCTEEEALLVCCGLAKLGYKLRFDEGRLLGPQSSSDGEAARACMRAILRVGGVVA